MGIINYNSGGWIKVKQGIKFITPPILVESVRRLRRTTAHQKAHSGEVREVIEWEYVPEGWQAEKSDPNIKGWSVDSILEAYKTNWPSFLRQLEGARPLGISPESDIPSQATLAAHNTMMSYAYAFAFSTRHKSSISMLDWGGGFGHYYLISQALISDLEIDYHCKDVQGLADHGRELFPQAHFYADESCLDRSYDFVLASSSLHYSPDWLAMLGALARATAEHIFITRLPIVQEADSYVFVQRPYRYGYDTEYLGWCLNRKQFLDGAQAAGLALVREFIIGEQPIIHGAPGPCEYRGFLFRQTGSDRKSR